MAANLDDIRISVVVLNFRTLEQTTAALRSACDAAADAQVDALIVDNSPSEESSGALQRECPGARVLPMESNVGFAAGMNAGIRAAVGDYILLLNSDVGAAPGSVADLARFMRDHPDVGLCSPQLIDENGRPSRTQILQPTVWRILAPFVGRLGHERWRARIGSEPLDVEATEGAAVMVSRAAVEQAGLLDEDFFFYHEIVEWCARMQDHGFRVVVVPGVRMVHACGGASKGFGRAARVELKRSEYQLVRKRLGAAVYGTVIARDAVREALSTLFYGAASLATLGLYRRPREKLAVHSAVLVWLFAGRPPRQSATYVRLFGRWD